MCAYEHFLHYNSLKIISFILGLLNNYFLCICVNFLSFFSVTKTGWQGRLYSHKSRLTVTSTQSPKGL